MKAEYKRDLQNNYLILEVGNENEEENYQLKMAQNNEIQGILAFHSSRTDGKLFLNYDITAKQPLDVLYEKKRMNNQDIISLLSEIKEIIDIIQKFLLDSSWLIFRPEYMYMDTNSGKLYLCYYPSAGDISVTELAEYILKRLNHEDQEAVTVGYAFYQKTREENFSLQKTLIEILTSAAVKKKSSDESEYSGYEVIHKERRQNVEGRASVAKEYNRRGSSSEKTKEQARAKSIVQTDREWDSREGRYINKSSDRQFEPDKYESFSGDELINRNVSRESRDKKEHTGLFQFIHPAVLISGILLSVMLCGLYYFNILDLTESGGIFFLIISFEVLLNRFWLNKKNKYEEQELWIEEEEKEAYRILQEEMYAEEEEDDTIEETRCLFPGTRSNQLNLVCTNSTKTRGFPDIAINETVIYVGKRKGESDVILDSPTISRLHARLEKRDGQYYIKDLNSRNGTFVNGDRLKPQEQRSFQEGDRIMFAEAEYVAEII